MKKKFTMRREFSLRKYFSFFRLRFNMGIQYRTAAVAGMVTQFVWGFMECFVYKAFYDSNPAAFPMEFSSMMAYIWLQQAFLMFFATWMMDNEIFDLIINGNIAYELCRPVSIYNMWFAKNAANRLSKAVLRCFPILITAFLLPKPFRMPLPKDMGTAILFVGTMALGLGVTIAFCILVYILSFFMVSSQGIRILLTSLVDFFCGSIVPIPFLPEPLRTIVELLPFAGMQNVPLRIYGGDLARAEMTRAVGLQLFWFVAMVGLGKWLCRIAERRVVVQGG